MRFNQLENPDSRPISTFLFIPHLGYTNSRTLMGHQLLVRENFVKKGPLSALDPPSVKLRRWNKFGKERLELRNTIQH